MNIQNNKGFSLAEILVAIVLIAGVLATAFTQLNPLRRKGKVREAKLVITNLENALGMFYMDCDFYPSEQEGLKALVSAPDRCESWGPEPYIKENKPLKDPWKNDFIYKAGGGDYEIISLGADGKEGGEGYDKDISSKDL